MHFLSINISDALVEFLGMHGFPPEKEHSDLLDTSSGTTATAALLHNFQRAQESSIMHAVVCPTEGSCSIRADRAVTTLDLLAASIWSGNSHLSARNESSLITYDIM